MQKIKYFLTPFSLFIISFLLRLSLISKGPYHLDCLTLAVSTQKTLLSHQLHYAHSHGFPLVTMLAIVFVYLAKLIGIDDPVRAINFMSVLFSSLCIPVFYMLVKKMLDEKSAIISAMLLCFSPIFLGVSVFGNSHTISLFFMLISLYFLIMHQERNEYWNWLFSAVFLGLSGAARIQEMVPMFIPVSFYIFKNKAGQKGKNFFIYWLMVSCTVLLSYSHLIAQRYIHFTGQEYQNLFYRDVLRYFKGLSWPIIQLSLKYVVDNFSYLGLLVVISGLILLWKSYFNLLIFLLIWAFCCFSPFSLLYSVVPRHLLLSLIPLYIFQGYFFSRLFQFNKLFKIGASFILILTLSLSFMRIYPILKTRHQHAYLPEFFEWISQHSEGNAVFIVADEGSFVYYYAKRKTMPRPLSTDRIKKEELNQFKQTLDSYLRKGTPVYITATGLFSHNPKGIFTSFISRNYHLRLQGVKIYEDWHRGVIYSRILYEPVFKIYTRE